MVLRFAPRAILIPISRVRSVTDTNIMFIRPIAAPKSVMSPITVAQIVMLPVSFISMLAMLSIFMTETESS